MVISGPAGAGKGTLSGMLLAKDGGFKFSVSSTTRERRPGERDGIDYDFISMEEFRRREADSYFLETAEVHGNCYGTPLKPIMQMLDDGHDMLLDIDPQGAIEMMSKIADCVTVFILPPSFEELERRLRHRGTECEADLQRRLRNAHGEVEQIHRYRYVLINDAVEDAYKKLEAIVLAERHSTVRYQPEIT